MVGTTIQTIEGSRRGQSSSYFSFLQVIPRKVVFIFAFLFIYSLAFLPAVLQSLDFPSSTSLFCQIFGGPFSPFLFVGEGLAP